MKETSTQSRSNPDQKQKGKPSLPIRTGYRCNRYGIKDGSISLLRAYSAGAIDRRRTDGRLITERENRYARHLGYTSYQALPITLAGKVHLVIRLELFLALHDPSPDSKTGFRDIRSAENSLNRIYTELGLRPPEKRIDIGEFLNGHTTRQEGA